MCRGQHGRRYGPDPPALSEFGVVDGRCLWVGTHPTLENVGTVRGQHGVIWIVANTAGLGQECWRQRDGFDHGIQPR